MRKRYARKGFTRTKAVRAILGGYEQQSRTSNARYVRFEGLPASDAARMLTKLPEAQQHDKVNTMAPSFATLVEVGLTVPGATFGGFRVDPDDPGERITLSRITVPSEARTTDSLDSLVSALPEHQHRLQIGDDGSAFLDWESYLDAPPSGAPSRMAQDDD